MESRPRGEPRRVMHVAAVFIYRQNARTGQLNPCIPRISEDVNVLKSSVIWPSRVDQWPIQGKQADSSFPTAGEGFR